MWLKLAILLVLSLAAHLEARGEFTKQQLSQYCQILEDESRWGGLDIGEDAEVYFKFAARKLTEMAENKYIGFQKKYAILNPWDRILHQRGCYKGFLKDIADIAKCNPKPNGYMKTLYQATHARANVCLTPHYIGGKIEKAAKGGVCLLPSCFKGISANVLIDHTFVEEYRKVNKDDKWMDLTAVKLEKIAYPLANSIARELEARKLRPELFSGSQNMREYLEKHLFNPCSSVVGTLARAMNDITDASFFYDRGLPSLLSRVDEEIQELALRYAICKAFEDLREPEKFADDLFDQYFKVA